MNDKKPKTTKLNSLPEKTRRWLRFVERRLDPDSIFGLYLTIGAILTTVFAYLFFTLLEDVVTKEPIVQFDARVLNLAQLYRSPTLSKVMLYITYIGRWQAVLLAVLFISLILFILRKRRYLYTILISVVVGEDIILLLKEIISRPRPPIINAITRETDFSFPSGHTFVAISFYGLIAFFLIRRVKSKWLKILFGLLGLAVIVLISFSRIYLGVHWPSDVFGSLLIGAAWLTVITTVFSIENKLIKSPEARPLLSQKETLVLSLIFAVIWFGYINYYYLTNPLNHFTKSKTETMAQTSLSSGDLPAEIFQNLPRFSETITGDTLEPINLIIVGPKSDLNRVFTQAGWVKTEQANFGNTWKLFSTALFKKSYLTAPGTPSFWDYRPNDFAYVLAGRTVGARYDVHFWSTPFVTDGQAVWLGTARYDNGSEITSDFLPTHLINPAIDLSREKVMVDLMATDRIKKDYEYPLIQPVSQHQKSDSPFYTDGQAVVIFLK